MSQARYPSREELLRYAEAPGAQDAVTSLAGPDAEDRPDLALTAAAPSASSSSCCGGATGCC